MIGLFCLNYISEAIIVVLESCQAEIQKALVEICQVKMRLDFVGISEDNLGTADSLRSLKDKIKVWRFLSILDERNMTSPFIKIKTWGLWWLCGLKHLLTDHSTLVQVQEICQINDFSLGTQVSSTIPQLTPLICVKNSCNTIKEKS